MEAEARELKVLRQVVECFEAIAEDYASKRRKPWSELLNPLSGSGLVLDAGSGGGRHAAYLARRGVEVVCLDASSSMLKQARRHDRELGLVRGDLRELPFRDACFEAVACVASIHHVPTRRLRLKALKEVSRVLKPDSSLIITAWSRWQPKLLAKALKAWLTRPRWFFELGDVEVPWTLRGRRYLRYYHLFTKGELKRLIEEAGLKVSWVKGFSPRPSLLPRNYAALAIKPSEGGAVA